MSSHDLSYHAPGEIVPRRSTTASETLPTYNKHLLLLPALNFPLSRQYSKKDKVAHFVHCDVTKYDQQANMFKAAKTHFGGVDIVINNAGIAERSPLWDDDKGLWKKVIDIDLSAVIEGTRLGIQAMREQGRGGVIINTASLAGLYPQALTPVYSAAKFGVVGLTRSCKELGDDIRVNAVAPRYVCV